jgi:hypothetical protein
VRYLLKQFFIPFGMRFILPLFVLALNSSYLNAQLTGTGFGKTRDEARREALADLSSQISVSVQTSSALSEIETTGKGYNRNFVRDVLTRSELPVLGATYVYIDKKGATECRATLDKSALTLYESELRNLLADANKLAGANDINSLSRLLSLSDQYAKFRLVMAFLGKTGLEEFPVSRSDLEARFEKAAGDITSLDQLAKAAALLFKDNGYYVFPPEVQNSKEITPFAAAVRERLTSALKTLGEPGAAVLKLTGSYTILENGIALHLRALSETGVAVQSAAFKLKPAAYEGYRVSAETLSLEALAAQDLLINNDLRAEIITSRGKNSLLFKGGESMKVLVKLSKPGYLYIIGHTQTGDSKFSYLVPIHDGRTKRDFVLFVNADDVNKWIEIGEFEISPPFGTETMQVFASTADIIDQVPDFYFDDKGYAVVGKNPVEVAVKTRAALKKKGTGQTKITEAVLTFTTVK